MKATINILLIGFCFFFLEVVIMPKCMFILNKVEKMEDDDDKALKVSFILLVL